MRQKMFRLGFVLLLPLAFSLTALAFEPTDKLTKDDKKVIEYLVKNWGEDYDVTSVDVAMASLGMKQSDETRLRIGAYIKQHPELHEVLRRWGWVTIVLNADEKLIARALINAQRDAKPSPTVSEVANAVNLTSDQVKRGLGMLEHYEIIKRDKSVDNIGYRVEARYLKWEPRLDFIFHTVHLSNGRQFNTN